MIGYYIHHVGRGHLHHAAAISAHLKQPVTALSSLPKPRDWNHEWLQLGRDDGGDPRDVAAGGRLHWAPVRHQGYRGRMARVAGWIAEHDPSVLVSDLSVEVTVLARLLGVPVVTTVLPGDRSDAAHQLAFDLAARIIAPWPQSDVTACIGLERHRHKVVHVGGISRFAGRTPSTPAAAGPRRVLRIAGRGDEIEGSRAPADWVERGPGNWVDDPWPDLCAANVVVSHCGLGAVADVAAARRPAVLIPRSRPHDEQRRTAAVLTHLGLAVVLDREPVDWEPALTAALRLDASEWARWSPADSAANAAAVIETASREAA